MCACAAGRKRIAAVNFRIYAAVVLLSFVFAGAGYCALKSDEPLYDEQRSDQEPEISGTVYTQSWAYTTDPNEYLTAIVYYIHPGDRFQDKPVFTATYTGDRTGWATRISPDGKTVCLFGPRTHFGPNPGQPYGISYRIQYEDQGASGLGQDTVVWLGDAQTYKWSRTAMPSGGVLYWSSALPCLYPTHSLLPTSWLAAGLSGEVQKPEGLPYLGQPMQVGPSMFGDLPGPWGALTSYGASSTLLQIGAEQLGDYGWAMRGTVRFLDLTQRAHVSEGSWWLYHKQMTDWPIEQGTYIMVASWPNGWDQPSTVTAKFFSQQGSTVVSPPWPDDCLDWSTLGGGTFSGTLSASNLLTGILNISENKLVLRVIGGQEIVYCQPNGYLDLELHQRDMAFCAAGYQAFLKFDASMLSYVSGSYTSSPFGLPAISPIAVSSNGEIDMAAGINVFLSQPPYASDAKLADLRFQAGAAEGITQVVFRSHDPESRFTDDQGYAAPTQTVNGPVVIVDGTPPTDVVISADPSTWTNQQIVTLTFSAADAFSGVNRYELQLDGGDSITAVSPYAWNVGALETGAYEVTVRAFDRAGNSAAASTTVYIDRTLPYVSIESAKQSGEELLSGGTAVQGMVDIYVAAGDAHSGLNGVPNVFAIPEGGNPQPADYRDDSGGVYHYQWEIGPDTPNGTAAIIAEARDAAGNSAWAVERTFQINKSQLSLEIDLAGVKTPVTRRIKLVIGGQESSGVPAETLTANVDFDTPVLEGATTVAMRGIKVFTALSNAGQWTHVGAKDEQHTLMSTVELTQRGDGQFYASLTGGDALIGGDATNDNLIDILDFGVLIGQYGQAARAWPARDADFDCSGVVDGSAEFSFIQIGFLTRGDPPPGLAAPDASADGPASSVSVTSLAAVIGSDAASRADLNGDGIVDTWDIQAFIDTYLKVKRGP